MVHQSRSYLKLKGQAYYSSRRVPKRLSPCDNFKLNGAAALAEWRQLLSA
jgi:hypothetical protein